MEMRDKLLMFPFIMSTILQVLQDPLLVKLEQLYLMEVMLEDL